MSESISSNMLYTRIAYFEERKAPESGKIYRCSPQAIYDIGTGLNHDH